MPGQKSSKSKKKNDGEKSEKSASKSKGKDKQKDKQKSPSKASKKEKEPKDKDSKKAQKSKKGDKSKKGQDDQSEVSSIIPTSPPPADCIHHKSPFIYYCQTCEQLICNQCTVYGPHNNHLHRILKITDAYRSRVFYLSEAIRSNLVDKRDKIIAQLHRLQYRIQEIRFVKNIIERDIRSQYSGILQRLKGFQGVKLANLSHEVSLIQKQIDTINDIGNEFFVLTTMDCQQVEKERKICKFLLKSKQMYEAIEYLINKPDRELPEIGVQQIPRQIQVNRQEIQKALASKEINHFKNQIIWNLSNDLVNQQAHIKKQVQEKANYIIKDLSGEVQELNQKLNKNKMVCYYCGIRSTPQVIIHNQCEKNISGAQLQLFATQKQPPQKFNNNGRHFFSKQIIAEQA